MKKTLSATFRALCAAFLVFVIFIIVRVVIVYFSYATLQEWFPSLFKTYSAISEKEQLEEVNRRIDFVCALISFFIMPFFAKKLDNARFESIVDKTDGFYRLRDGLAIYLSDYTVADSVALLLSPAPYIPLLLIELPKKLERSFGFILTPLDPFRAIADVSGLVGAYFVIVAVTLLAAIPANLSALKHWRGLWLAEIE